MKREVIIDESRVDMPEGGEPGIVYNNPIFVDASQIKTNRTTTFNVPITDKNRALLGYSDNVNVDSDFPRLVHTLNEYRDGVPIIQNAQAKLLSIGENFEFSVTWGILKNVQDILKIKINELKALPSLVWNSSTSFYVHNSDFNLRPNVAFLQAQTFAQELSVEFNMEFHFPSVNVLFLINQIASNVGLTFSYGSGVENMMRDYYIPLLTKKRDTTDITDPSLATAVRLWYDSVGAWTIPPQSRYQSTRDPLGIMNYQQPDSDPSRNIGAILLPNGSYKVQVSLVAMSSSGFFSAYDEAVVFLQTASGNGDAEQQMIRIDKQSNTQIVGTDEVNIEVDNVLGRSILGIFVFVRRYGGQLRRIPVNLDNAPPDPNASVSLLIWRAEGDVVYNVDNFPIVNNLPDISAIDYIKDMCFFFGLYILPNLNNELRFEFTDSIINKQSAPEIIEDYLITRNYKSQAFTFGDYARINTLEYAEDERVRINANGVINVDNLTLEESRQMFELKFAASDMTVNNLALVELFEREIDDEGVTTYNFIGESLTPRILKYSATATNRYSQLVFPAEMYFSNIITSRYRVISSLVESAKVVNIDVYFDNIRLYRFNELDVFYFYGSYWLLITGTIANGVLSGEFVHFPLILT